MCSQRAWCANCRRIRTETGHRWSFRTNLEQTELDRYVAAIERIDLFPEKRKDGCWIRNIVFTLPVPIQGHEVKELPLEKSTLIESVVIFSGNAATEDGVGKHDVILLFFQELS